MEVIQEYEVYYLFALALGIAVMLLILEHRPSWDIMVTFVYTIVGYGLAVMIPLLTVGYYGLQHLLLSAHNSIVTDVVTGIGFGTMTLAFIVALIWCVQQIRQINS